MSIISLFKSKPRTVEIKTEQRAEIILSDGSFAQIFGLKTGHIIASEDSNHLMQMVKIVTMCVKLDEMPLSLEDVLNLPVSDFEKIIEQLAKYK